MVLVKIPISLQAHLQLKSIIIYNLSLILDENVFYFIKMSNVFKVIKCYKLLGIL